MTAKGTCTALLQYFIAAIIAQSALGHSVVQTYPAPQSARPQSLECRSMGGLWMHPRTGSYGEASNPEAGAVGSPADCGAPNGTYKTLACARSW
jgi:hypothetical protein